jgi:plasmid stability protein
MLATSMSTLYVREVPDDVYEAIRRLTDVHKTSISAEAVRLLRRALRHERAGVSDLLDEVETGRPRVRSARLSAAALIRQERDSR